MRTKMKILMLGIATMLASCSQDDVLQDTVNKNGELKPVTITATLPDGGMMRTRAASEATDDAATRCLMQMIVDGKKQGVQEMTAKDGTFSLTVSLDKAKKYTFLFWADGGDTYYTYADDGLENVTAKSVTGVPGVGVAWKGTAAWDNTKASTDIKVPMTHAVSKVTLKSTTNIDANAAVSVTLTDTYMAYNVNEDNGSVTGDVQETIFTAPKVAITESADGAEVFSFYALTTDNNQDLTVSHNNKTQKVTNVPIAPNKHTILVGDVAHIGLTGTDFTATIDESWNVDELEIGIDGNYIVSSEADLRTWTEIAKKNLKAGCTLTNDIELTGENNWPQIGTESTPYTGTFDGAGHTISGMDIRVTGVNEGNHSYGFIGFLGKEGVVKNLSVENAVINVTGNGKNAVDTYVYIGGVVGSVKEGIISGCSSSGQLQGSQLWLCSIGGVVGYALGNAKVIGCSFSGEELQGTDNKEQRLGCVLGEAISDKNEIISCWTTSAITYTTKREDRCGSIVGSLFEPSVVTNSYYSNSDGGVGYGDGTDNSVKVDGTVTWATAKADMNTALADTGLQWVENPDAGADKDKVPLVLQYTK
jgi:the GLUG motif protein family protein